MNDRILSLLGICKRAGLLVNGEELSEQAIKNGKAQLVLLAEDSSDNTKKKFKNMCEYRNINYKEISTKKDLAIALGKEITAVVVILDINFAEKIESLIENK
jgi:ribosomal protein L7Ae-like RNA K-turn-binding protein